MDRVIEPEIMLDADQAVAYYQADQRLSINYIFKIAYSSVKKKIPESIIDLGCGPGDLTHIMSELFPPSTKFVAVDGSQAMIDLAKKDNNVIFKKMLIEDVTEYYEKVISSLTLHHFHNPLKFWNTIKNINPVDVFILDLVRPDTEEALQEILEELGPFEDDLFRLDFENSLRAAFTIEEIEDQLKSMNLLHLNIHKIDQFQFPFDLMLIAGIVKK